MALEFLWSKGITVCIYPQQVGDILVQFPYTYHAGLNSGNNLNEACNWAPKDWIQCGLFSNIKW